MIFIAVAMLVAAYALAASWAAPRGATNLWLTALITVALMTVGTVILGRSYAVPDPPRLLLYALALTGPIVLIPTLMLSRIAYSRSEFAARLGIAIVGADVGAFGWGIVVFGLGVW